MSLFGGKFDPPGLNFQLQQGQVFPGTRRPQVTDISASEVKKIRGDPRKMGFAMSKLGFYGYIELVRWIYMIYIYIYIYIFMYIIDR